MNSCGAARTGVPRDNQDETPYCLMEECSRPLDCQPAANLSYRSRRTLNCWGASGIGLSKDKPV